MSTITRVPTSTIRDEWSPKVPSQAPHLNLDEGVATVDTADYVGASGGQTNEYGGFDFSAIPAGSVINSIMIRQRSVNVATQARAATRFALRVSGSERASATYDATTAHDETHEVPFATSGITRDELAAGLLTIEKATVSGAPGEHPPVPEQS